MALACTGKVGVTITLTQTNALDLSTPTDSLVVNKSRTLTSGTGADQVDLIWHDQRTLTDGATEALDLHGGTISGAFGTITMDKLKGIMIANTSVENGLKIGGVASAVGLCAATTDIIVLPPASATNKPSILLIEAPAAAGIDVTSNAIVQVEHDSTTSNSVTYEIAVWGED